MRMVRHRAMSTCCVLWILFILCGQTISETKPEKQNGPVVQTPPPLNIETQILGFRLWMIVGMITLVFVVLIIILCCAFNCRIPRTKQQINADYDKKQLVSKEKKRRKMQAKLQAAYGGKVVRYGQQRQPGGGDVGNAMPQRGRVNPPPPTSRANLHAQQKTATNQASKQQQIAMNATPLTSHPADYMQQRKPMMTSLGGPSQWPGQAGASRTLAAIPSPKNQRV